MGIWKTQKRETTRISQNSIIFVNLVMCTPFGSSGYNTIITNYMHFWVPIMCIA